MNIHAWTPPTAERFPQWDDEPAQEPLALPCITGEAEVGFLLPQLLATPGCPSRSRLQSAFLEWLGRVLSRRAE